MQDNLISVIKAATQLCICKQTLFKKIKRLGVSTIKKRNSNHRNQMVSYISKEDFKLIIRDESMRLKQKKGRKTTLPFQVDRGLFYLIQLEPDHDPGRFKVGFASNMAERLRDHRCSAPFAEVLETWPCHKLWEKTAIVCVTQSCEKVHTDY
jgi:hypothetical protein